MAIAAHPGDAMFSMGAAVAQHVHNGGSGILLSLSLGEKGHPKIEPARYGEMQREAAVHAASMLGAATEFLTYPDAGIPSGDPISLKVSDLVRRHRPNIVVTHWSGSWHKDHQNTHLVVRDAIFYAGLAALEGHLPAHQVSRLLYADNWEDATNYQPDLYLDITAVYDPWAKACAVFPMWRGETGLIRYNDYYQSLAAARGALAGCRYAVALMTDPEQRLQRLRSLDA
jgi:LmbE family N-acetylglucosaminyl deacetylase